MFDNSSKTLGASKIRGVVVATCFGLVACNNGGSQNANIGQVNNVEKQNAVTWSSNFYNDDFYYMNNISNASYIPNIWYGTQPSAPGFFSYTEAVSVSNGKGNTYTKIDLTPTSRPAITIYDYLKYKNWFKNISDCSTCRFNMGDLIFQYVPDRQKYRCNNIILGTKAYSWTSTGDSMVGSNIPGQFYTDSSKPESSIPVACLSNDSNVTDGGIKIFNVSPVNKDVKRRYNVVNSESAIMTNANLGAKIAYYFSQLSKEQKIALINDGSDSANFKDGDIFISPDVAVSANDSVLSMVTYDMSNSTIESLPAVALTSTVFNNTDVNQTSTSQSYSKTVSQSVTTATTYGWSEAIGLKLAWAKAPWTVEVSGTVTHNLSTTDSITTSQSETLTVPSQSIILPPHSCAVVITSASNEKISGTTNVSMQANPYATVNVELIDAYGNVKLFKLEKLNLYKLARVANTDGLLGSDDNGHVWINGASRYSGNNLALATNNLYYGTIATESSGAKVCQITASQALDGSLDGQVCENGACGSGKSIQVLK